MDRHGLTLDAVAEATGISRRSVATYSKHGTAKADAFRVRHLVAYMRRKDRQKGADT